MYPRRELIRLAAAKAVLCDRIGAQRASLAIAATEAARPLARIDRARAFWHGLTPGRKIALITAAAMGTRTMIPSRRMLKLLLRWSPLLFRVLRGIRRSRLR